MGLIFVHNNDSDILSVVRRNTSAGFRLLLEKYQEPVYWHIRRLTVIHADAQDAMQETFMRAYLGISRLRGGDVTLQAWIFRIATNEALRIIERRRTDSVSIDDDDALAVHQLAADQYVDYSDLEAIRLQRAIQTLPPKQKIAFSLRYYEDMDYQTIAQVTDSTPAKVKANYHTAKEKIIKYLNSHD